MTKIENFKLKLKNTKNKDDHTWKMTLNGRQPQNIDYGISQQLLIRSCSIFKLKLMRPKSKLKNTLNEDDHAWKMTLNGRQPQNIDCGISQQPLIGSCSN